MCYASFETQVKIHYCINLAMLTLKEFNKIPAGKIFATGILPNSPEGLNMVNSHQGEKLLWLAKKGYAPEGDWSIYCHWLEKGLEFVEREGDKVIMPSNIQKCVLCTDEVLKLYRL
jgi:hypothetical protein